MCVCIGVFVYVIIFPLLSLFVIRSEYCPFYTKKGGICVGVYISPVRVFVKAFIFPLLRLFMLAFDIYPFYTKKGGICEGIYISSISINILSIEPTNHIS